MVGMLQVRGGNNLQKISGRQGFEKYSGVFRYVLTADGKSLLLGGNSHCGYDGALWEE